MCVLTHTVRDRIQRKGESDSPCLLSLVSLWFLRCHTRGDACKRHEYKHVYTCSVEIHQWMSALWSHWRVSPLSLFALTGTIHALDTFSPQWSSEVPGFWGWGGVFAQASFEILNPAPLMTLHDAVTATAQQTSILVEKWAMKLDVKPPTAHQHVC